MAQTPTTNLLAALAALLLLPGCSSTVPQERSDLECRDGLDNDSDGLIDCADPDCRARPICTADAGPDLPRVDQAAAGERRPDLGADAMAAIPEVEPNNGTTSSELQAISVPVLVSAAIGVPDDVDVFGWTAAAGDRITVRVKTDGTMQPHLAVFGAPALKVPAAVSTGSGEVMAEYYALVSGSYFIGVRDRRNVGSGSAHVGGPTFTYMLSVTPLDRAALPAQVGGEVKGDLSPAGTIGVYSFTAVAGDQLQVTVLAARLTPPSELDARLSLFNLTQKTYHGTNDSMGLNQPDALLEGPMPFSGTYHAIVENEGTATSNLGFVLKITKLP